MSYLGPDLPAEEIATVARKKNSRVVALSLIYPSDDAGIGNELRRLRKYLTDQVVLVVGGAAASSYRSYVQEINAIELAQISDLRRTLRELRDGHVN